MQLVFLHRNATAKAIKNYKMPKGQNKGWLQSQLARGKMLEEQNDLFLNGYVSRAI